jgi:hypothetical protein
MVTTLEWIFLFLLLFLFAGIDVNRFYCDYFTFCVAMFSEVAVKKYNIFNAAKISPIPPHP